ncbi:MAG: hypothetical protein SGI73_18025 [Chloroflexota bacterium]|nr:hypothetical protein [Chloroflexota bacterium]
MRKWIGSWIGIIALMILATAAGAQTTPEYLVRNIRTVLNATPGAVIIAFEIENAGADATVPGTVNLVLAATGEVIAAQSIPPLVSSGQQAFQFDVPTTGYEVGQRISFGVQIDLPGVTPAAGGGFDGQTGVVIPSGIATDAGAPPDETPSERLTIFGLEPVVVAVGALIGFGVLLIVLWVLSMIARALFTTPPTFGAWQPPYAANPMIDPNSIAGRRQLWQQHAQSDALTMPCALNSYMVRKLPIGIDDKKLSGWRVTAIRLSQYDMYGRVDRSETLIERRVVNTLDRAARKTADSMSDAKQIDRIARPIAGKLIRALLRRTGRRNLMLPIALDIRLTGKANEVDVLFELHRCAGNTWEMVDRWQTDLYAVSDQVLENFTYTLFGQQSGETTRAFHDRLRTDLTRLLSGMLYQPPSSTAMADEVTLADLEPIDFAALAETISLVPTDAPRVTGETRDTAASSNPTAPTPAVQASDTTPNRLVE